MSLVPPARHLQRAKDVVDHALRRAPDRRRPGARAKLSPAHFSREFQRAFGEPPHRYLMTRRLERAAALLRTTDWSVAEICCAVGLQGIGSFTTSFGRMYGCSPTSYRRAHPSAAALALIPGCVVRAYSRPQHRTFREDDLPAHP